MAKTFPIDLSLTEALLAYLFYGLDPGSGGRAVLLLDVKLAQQKAHELSRHTMANMVKVVKNFFPAECCGSAENIATWCEQGGIQNDAAEKVMYILGHEKYEAIKELEEISSFKHFKKME